MNRVRRQLFAATLLLTIAGFALEQAFRALDELEASTSTKPDEGGD